MRALGVTLLVVFIVSLGILAFDISLTCIFSVLLRYHLGVLVISVVMCGLGVVFPTFLWFIASLFAISLPLLIIILFKTPLANYITQLYFTVVV